MSKRIMVVLVALLLLDSYGAQAGTVQKISTLFVQGNRVAPFTVDTKLHGLLMNAGIDIQADSCPYAELDAKRLAEYNVLIMVQSPTAGTADTVASFRRCVPLILDYVRNGGGLILIVDENYESYKVANELLGQIGAEVLPEAPVDPGSLYQQPAYLRHWYCSTNNIKSHPVTEGISSLWYPLGPSPDMGATTYVLQFDSEWAGLVYANPSAYYYRTKLKEEGKCEHDSPQAVLGVRELGKGRAIAFSSRSLNYIEHPYHATMEGICLDRGNGLRLVENMLRWAAQPALNAGSPGGYIEPEPKVEKPKAAPEEFEKMDHYERLALFGRKPKVMPATYSGPYHDGMRDFTGLIGAHSVYSRSKDHPYLPGRGTVKEYCNAAKNCGYSFIVFTEIFENMSREKWDALVADCKAESNDDFVAIAGIEIKDTFGVTWIAFDLTRWPDAEWLDESGTMIGNSPGFYFGLGHGMMEFVSRYLIDSDRSFFKPWEAKFYSGIEIMAYDRGRFLLSDTFDSYVKCQSNDFNIIPITTQRLYSPLEVRGPLGVLTHVRANGAGEIPLKFRYTWYKERDVYVSSGPELTQWTMENGRGSIREEEWRVKLAVKSDAPLKSVVVYDRDRIFRRFLPDGNEFQTTIAGYHDKQYFLLVVAEDVKGGKLVSSALYASDGRQSQYMCTDLQNTINGCWGVKPNGEQVFYPGLGYGVTGWDQINVSVAQPDLLPRTGFEFGYGSWGFSSSGNLPGMDGNCWGMAARDMAFSTGDCNILRDVFDTTLVDNFPSEITSLETVCRHIGYTPRMGGLNIHRAQHSVTLLRDYKLPEGQESQFLSCMRGGFADGHFPTYVIVDEFGRKTTAPRDNNTSLDVILRPGSYFASFPYMWGSFAIMPRSGPVHLRVRGGAWEVGHDVTSDLDKGAKFLADIVFICGKFGTEDEADFDHFREVFGMAGAPLYDYEITRGSLLSTRYMFMVQAESGWAEANIGQANMGSDLPINVYGLNENWDAGMLNLDTGELRRVGVFESTAILSQNIDHRALRFACGNLVTCDDPDVALNIFQREGKWSIDAHNRSSGAVKTRVRTAPWLKGVAPSLDRVVEIPAGSTVTVSL